MKPLCAACPHRDTCTRLCDEARAYADQDVELWGDEIVMFGSERWEHFQPTLYPDEAIGEYELGQAELNIIERAKLTKAEKLIAVLYFFKKMTQEEIAAITGFSQRGVGKKLAKIDRILVLGSHSSKRPLRRSGNPGKSRLDQ